MDYFKKDQQESSIKLSLLKITPVNNIHVALESDSIR